LGVQAIAEPRGQFDAAVAFLDPLDMDGQVRWTTIGQDPAALRPSASPRRYRTT
jgi:hypothetical protein